jgi:hypothetical protein
MWVALVVFRVLWTFVVWRSCQMTFGLCTNSGCQVPWHVQVIRLSSPYRLKKRNGNHLSLVARAQARMAATGHKARGVSSFPTEGGPTVGHSMQQLWL